MCARSRSMADGRHRLSVIIVSANSASWLRPCLETVFQRAGDVDVDVVVVAAGCTDETVPLVEREFPEARTISVRQPRFRARQQLRAPHGGRRLGPVPESRYRGPRRHARRPRRHGWIPIRPSDWSACARSRPTVGSLQRFAAFPTQAVRSSRRSGQSTFRFGHRGSASGSWIFVSTTGRSAATGRAARSCSRAGKRSRAPVSWTSASSSTARRLTSASGSSRQVGRSAHLPHVTILHHENKAGWNPRLDAQAAYAKRQYFRKHFSPLHRLAAMGGLVLGYSLRSALGPGGPGRRESSRAALATLVGRRPPPFGAPPKVALTYNRRV